MGCGKGVFHQWGSHDGKGRKGLTLVYYTQVKNGKTYPKQRGGKRLFFVNDVYRKDGKVHTKYVGIREAPKDVEIEERRKVEKK